MTSKTSEKQILLSMIFTKITDKQYSFFSDQLLGIITLTYLERLSSEEIGVLLKVFHRLYVPSPRFSTISTGWGKLSKIF
jgi:hypothetical protein